MKIPFKTSWKFLTVAGLTALLLSGCGGKEEVTFAPIDNTEEVEEYYATFKRAPLALKAKLIIFPQTWQATPYVPFWED